MKLTLSILLILNIGYGYAQCNTNPPVTYNLTQTSPGELYRPSIPNLKGKDTINIMLTSYSVVELYNLAGDECNPVVVKANTGFQTPAFRITGNSRYLKIIADTVTRNIKVNVFSVVKAHHIEAIGLECFGSSIGVYCRFDVNANDTSSWFNNYVMNKISFRHFYIHTISGEAMYIGNTQPNGYIIQSPYTGNDTLIPPIRLDSIEVSNCRIDSVGWDAIQLSNCRNNAKIFNNTITNFGLSNQPSQQGGIVLGGNSTGSIYNNTIRKGTGNGIQFFGYSEAQIYNNLIDSVGFSGRIVNDSVVGDQSVYTNDNLNTVESNPPHSINFYGNTVKHYQKAEAIRVANYNNTSAASNIGFNTFCIPAANPANWESQYLIINPPSSLIHNNTLSCQQSCNCTITNILRSGKYVN